MKINRVTNLPVIREGRSRHRFSGVVAALKAAIEINRQCVELLERWSPAWRFQVETNITTGEMRVAWSPNEKVGWLKRTWYRILGRTPSEERVRRFLASDKSDPPLNN